VIPVIFVVSTISVIPTVSVIGCVDLSIILLIFQGPLATLFKEQGLSLRGFDAHINNYEQITHYLGLLHCDLLNNLDVPHPVMKGIDDLDVLDIQDSIPGIVEMFHSPGGFYDSFA
jgi:hypothetical protein